MECNYRVMLEVIDEMITIEHNCNVIDEMIILLCTTGIQGSEFRNVENLFQNGHLVYSLNHKRMRHHSIFYI